MAIVVGESLAGNGITMAAVHLNAALIATAQIALNPAALVSPDQQETELDSRLIVYF